MSEARSPLRWGIIGLGWVSSDFMRAMAGASSPRSKTNTPETNHSSPAPCAGTTLR